MTTFNPDNKDSLTYGECLGPAMEITDPADARQYLDSYISFIQSALDETPSDDGKTAAEIASINLGYYAGYYDHETRVRVERLFTCAHPIIGSAAKHEPSAHEAFEAGKAAAASRP